MNLKEKICYLLLIPFFLGLLLPDFFWGTHGLTFLGKFHHLIFLLIVIVIGFFDFSNLKFELNRKSIPLIALLFVLIIWNFPIQNDNYGDAFQYQKLLEETMGTNPFELDEIWSFNSLASFGRKVTLNIFNIFSYLFESTYGTVFKVVGAVFGFGFILFWLRFIRATDFLGIKLVLSVLLIIAAPCTLVFYGHIETYAPLYFVLSAFVILLTKSLINGNLRFYFYAGLILLFLPFLHPITLLLIPIYGIVGLVLKYEMKFWSLFLKIVYPIYVSVGIVLYFFVFEDHIDPRFMEGVRDIDRLFLPLFSPDAPLDNYNLFSWQHFLDLFNLLFYWSPVFVLLIYLGVFQRRKINWNCPLIVIGGSGLILLFSFLFALNPLLGLPMDWDLFSIPSPFIIVLSIGLISQLTFSKSQIKVYLISSVFGLTSIVVNLIEVPNANRVESLGVWNYQSYYLRTNINLIHSAGIISKSSEEDYLEVKSRQENLLKGLRSLSSDPMLAGLFYDDAYFALTVKRDYELAINKLNKSIYAYPGFNEAKLLLMRLYEQIGECKLSEEVSLELLNVQFPNKVEAIKNYKRITSCSRNSD